MEKGLSMAAGQTPCQKYWDTLLKLIQARPASACPAQPAPNSWAAGHHRDRRLAA